MRGLNRNQLSTSHFIYKNDQCNKINSHGDFEDETPTYLGAAHVILKVEQKFQNRNWTKTSEPRNQSHFFTNKKISDFKSITEKNYVWFQENKFEFGIISNDFWSSTIWAIHIQVSVTEFKNPENPGIQPKNHYQKKKLCRSLIPGLNLDIELWIVASK